MSSFTYLLDTDILSDLVRHPAGKIAQRIKAIHNVVTL
jgi:predicted nucleic acid-binding protein